MSAAKETPLKYTPWITPPPEPLEVEADGKLFTRRFRYRPRNGETVEATVLFGDRAAPRCCGSIKGEDGWFAQCPHEAVGVTADGAPWCDFHGPIRAEGRDMTRARFLLGEAWGLDEGECIEQAELGEVLGLRGRDLGQTIADYERGKTGLSGPVRLAMQALLSGWKPSNLAELQRAWGWEDEAEAVDA